ncbi:MAG: hypothetical protein LC118_00090 [Dehalococcoidia bacterium]|nr:hypothetical protein [Dehalococcoidia bacterium]
MAAGDGVSVGVAVAVAVAPAVMLGAGVTDGLLPSFVQLEKSAALTAHAVMKRSNPLMRRSSHARPAGERVYRSNGDGPRDPCLPRANRLRAIEPSGPARGVPPRAAWCAMSLLTKLLVYAVAALLGSLG